MLASIMLPRFLLGGFLQTMPLGLGTNVQRTNSPDFPRQCAACSCHVLRRVENSYARKDTKICDLSRLLVVGAEGIELRPLPCEGNARNLANLVSVPWGRNGHDADAPTCPLSAAGHTSAPTFAFKGLQGRANHAVARP